MVLIGFSSQYLWEQFIKKNLSDFILWFQKNVLILAPQTTVSLIVLPLSIGQFDVMQILGNAENIDLDMLTGRKHTLII